MAGKGEQWQGAGLGALWALRGPKEGGPGPVAGVVVEGTVRLVSLLRESFIGQIMARRSGLLELGEPEERSSTDHSLEAMVRSKE